MFASFHVSMNAAWKTTYWIKHAKPDTVRWYKCDDCTFKTKDKSIFGEHFKQKHGFDAPSKKLEGENRLLKNNLERLEATYMTL